MRIKKLIIYGYGKWVDTEFVINPSLQVIYGQNEAGKSTLMSFIQSILFGFPMRHSSSLRYEPKESSRYGGKIIIDDERFGEVSIERVNGKVTGDVIVTLEDGTQGEEKLLDTLLNHKKRPFYESIYSFNLKGVEETSEMNKEQFNRFFLSVGSMGNENFLKKADAYKQKASQVFKPTGRKPKLNLLFDSLQKQKAHLDSAKESNERYVLLVKEKEEIIEKIDDLEQSSQEKKRKVEEVQHLLKNIETINEINELKKEIDYFPSYSLPEDGLIHLNHINKQLEELREQTKELYEQQKVIQEKYRPSKDLLIYQEYEESVNRLMNNWEQLELKVELIKESQQDLSLLEKQSFEFKLREGLPLNESLPKKLTPAEKNELISYTDTLSSIKENRIKLEKDIQVLDLKIKTNDDRIDAIEQSLWPASQFKEAEIMEEETDLSGNSKRSLATSPAFIYSIGVVMVGLLYLIAQSLSVLLLLPLYIILATVYLNRGSKRKDNDTSDYNRSDYYHQKSLREQWKDTLASNDAFQQEIKDHQSQLRKNVIEHDEVIDQFEEWKLKHNYPSSYLIETVLATLNQLEDLRKIDELKENEEIKLKRQINELDQELKENNYSKLFYEEGKECLSVFTEVRRSMRQIENDKRMQQAYIKETEKVQNTILYYVQQEKEQLKLKNKLNMEAGVHSEDEFIKAYETMSKKNEKIKRYDLLRQTIQMNQSDKGSYTVEGLKKEIEELRSNTRQLQDQQKELTKYSIEIDYKLSELEEGGLYSDLLQKYESEKSMYQEAADEWSTYKIASALIENTLNNAKENQLPQTIKLAGEYFSYITSNEYSTILLETDQFYVVDKKGGKWQANELSRGTVEPLYIAIRLAFVVNNKDHIRFPVIIDDSFVNIDEKRKSNIYSLLTDISRSVQIIYFTFDEKTLDYINSPNVITLDYIN